MKLLIMGGTRFLGRHLAQQALDAGHRVTLLHRGRSGAGLFPQAEHRIADRDGDPAALAGSDTWDSVLDTSAYVPRQVHAVAARLAGRVGQYQLVSTISVYASLETPPDEDSQLATLADPGTEAVTGETYGGLKALCERAAQQAFGARCLIARPGLIVGPHDPSGRFTWWLQRLARAAPGEAVLAPGRPDAPAQFIDARDAAAWMLLQAGRGSGGVFNLVGPEAPLSMGEFLETARQALAPAARLEWVDEAFLLARGVAPWTDLPVWVASAEEALHRTRNDRALASGLRCRALGETVRDTAEWARDQAERPGIGLAAAREAELLRAWELRGN